MKKEGGAEAATTTNHNVRDSINIQGTVGDVFGVGVRGSDNVIGKNIVVGDSTINVSQQELSKIPVSKYAKALDDFSKSINQQKKRIKGVFFSLILRDVLDSSGIYKTLKDTEEILYYDNDKDGIYRSGGEQRINVFLENKFDELRQVSVRCIACT